VRLVIITIFWILSAQALPINRLGEREKSSRDEILGDPILFTLEKDLKNVQEILADLLRQDDHFNIPFESPIIYPRWKYVGGPMLGLDAGKDGTLFAISANKNIYKFKEERMMGVTGLASQISVGSKDHVCAIGPNGSIFKLDRFQKWRGQKGKAKFISCGFDGTMVAIYRDLDAKRFNLKAGSLIIKRKGKWRNFPGQLEIVSVGSKNNIWGLKSSGSVWFFNGKKWDRRPGEMVYISTSADGTVAAIGKNGGAYLWDGLDWVNVPGVNLVLISVQGNGKYWAITADGSLWKSLKE